MLYLWIMLGSALGGAARYWLSGVIANSFGETFPWGTILVNVSGCFVIGFFATLTGPDGRLVVGTTTRQFVMVGLCGGYTTFSSFSLQTLYLARDGDWLRASGNIFLSLALCFFAVWLGHIAAGATGDAAGALIAYEERFARRRELAQEKASPPAKSDQPTGLDQGAAAGAGLAASDEDQAQRRGLAIDKTSAAFRRDQAIAFSKSSDAKLQAGDAAGALAAYEGSLAIRRDLATDKSNAEAQHDQAAGLGKVADALLSLGKLEDALASDADALAILERLAQLDGGGEAAQNNLANALQRVGSDLRALGRLDQAFVDYDRALAVGRQLSEAHPEAPTLRGDVREAAESMGGLAYELLLARKYAKSLEASDRAIAAAPGLVWLYANRAHALMFLGRTHEARTLYHAHRGEKTHGDKIWEAAIRDDFAEMRKAGLSRPLMHEIERLFAEKGQVARPRGQRHMK
jgi:CrcB protein